MFQTAFKPTWAVCRSFCFLQKKIKDTVKTMLDRSQEKNCFFFPHWDKRWLNGVRSTQKTYSYQNFFGGSKLCCLNIFLLLCTHQAQKLLKLSKRTPHKMSILVHAMHANNLKKQIYVKWYLRYVIFRSRTKILKTHFSRAFWSLIIFVFFQKKLKKQQI